jgi:hypothetical protein
LWPNQALSLELGLAWRNQAIFYLFILLHTNYGIYH